MRNIAAATVPYAEITGPADEAERTGEIYVTRVLGVTCFRRERSANSYQKRSAGSIAHTLCIMPEEWRRVRLVKKERFCKTECRSKGIHFPVKRSVHGVVSGHSRRIASQ